MTPLDASDDTPVMPNDASQPDDDLHAMLVARGDWVPLGAADEQKDAAEGTVEA
jgi:hypothetical protein